jgi:hypothetical protein
MKEPDITFEQRKVKNNKRSKDSEKETFPIFSFQNKDRG